MRSTVAVAVLFASTAGFWIGTAAAQGAAAAPPPGARQRCLALNNLKIPAFLNALGQGPVPSTWLGALDAWVDGGRAPGTLEAVDINPENHQRRRPLCVYPSWPRYTGTGDVNAASSFRCVTGDDASQTN